ncbi:MAG: D-aminoacyl-tRNA deacylase [Flavobacteriaceae bacterium]
MRIVIQRVTKAKITIDRLEEKTMGVGLVVLLGITHEDTEEDVFWLVNKMVHLRIFNDRHGVMNRSVKDAAGSVLIVSQFTLMAATKKGNRPSYLGAAKHEHATPLYELFLQQATMGLGREVLSGKFGADMQIDLTNDGPVTLVIDSKNKE